jgi:two-component system response regulator TctD
MSPHPRVLVADDDPLLLDAVADALVDWGAEVIRARSGAELIDQLAGEGPFDLVVTDISMPWMSGLQAMQSARTAGLGTSVIVMTALKDERLSAHVQRLGRHAVLLRKPFDLNELETLVATLLSTTLSDRGPADPARKATDQGDTP